jgi:transposase InsO family protein
MRQAGIRSIHRRKYRANKTNNVLQISENRLNQHFWAQAPNQTWVADITYISTKEGWLYLAAVLDVYSRKIIGWSMANQITQELALNALNMALTNRKPTKGLLHHSDRGCQYTGLLYQQTLAKHGITSSVSRPGNCWDNAMIESFFHTLKVELINNRKYATRSEARKEIFEYIEVFYNRIRLHSGIGYISPEIYEKRSSVA